MARAGEANTRIAADLGVSPATVTAWRQRFEAEGLKGLSGVRAGRGRKPSIPDEKVAQIVRLTLTEKPPGETHWSCRSMAEAAGVSPATVQRIWSARGLKPHRVDTFKLSTDPLFEEKLVDVVGLYLNPPEKAIVLCMDEKSHIQALDRTQPSLPMKPGRAGTMTHDYKRNGTTTLFAALHVLTGSIIGECLPRHRHEEFLKSLRIIDREVPKGLEIHMILDNYRTHEHADVNAWLAKHPRFHLHFTPTLKLVAEPGRAVFWQAHRQGHPPWRLPQRPRPDRRDRRLPGRDQRRPPAVHVDRKRRLDPREGPPRPRDPRRNQQLKPRHCTRSPANVDNLAVDRLSFGQLAAPGHRPSGQATLDAS
jgi:transposase